MVKRKQWSLHISFSTEFKKLRDQVTVSLWFDLVPFSYGEKLLSIKYVLKKEIDPSADTW